jgi:hypothetical protein
MVIAGGLVWSACSDSSSDSAVRTDDGSTPGLTDVTSSATASPTTVPPSSTDTTSVRATPTETTSVPATPTETTAVPPTTQPPSTEPPSTEVVEYSPFGADGDLTAPAERQEPGTCWSEALAASSDRLDAYRCMNDASSILDPCFSPPVAVPSQVACPSLSDPNDSGVVLLDLTEPLPDLDHVSTGVSRPFYLVLEDGTACTPFTGTRVMVEGIWMDYGCGGPETGLLLLGGALDTTSAEWTLLTTDADRTEPLTTTMISTAYV